MVFSHYCTQYIFPEGQSKEDTTLRAEQYLTATEKFEENTVTVQPQDIV